MNNNQVKGATLVAQILLLPLYPICWGAALILACVKGIFGMIGALLP